MSASMEERKRVARKLRMVASNATNCLSYEAFRFALGKDASDTCRDVFLTLADLIEPDKCTWIADENGVYHTTCGQAHVFEFDGVSENGYRYCPYCSGLIVEGAC